MNYDNIRAQYAKNATTWLTMIGQAERAKNQKCNGYTLAELRQHHATYSALSRSTDGELAFHFQCARLRVAERLAELRAR